jgi:hypothetical protein
LIADSPVIEAGNKGESCSRLRCEFSQALRFCPASSLPPPPTLGLGSRSAKRLAGCPSHRRYPLFLIEWGLINDDILRLEILLEPEGGKKVASSLHSADRESESRTLAAETLPPKEPARACVPPKAQRRSYRSIRSADDAMHVCESP